MKLCADKSNIIFIKRLMNIANKGVWIILLACMFSQTASAGPLRDLLKSMHSSNKSESGVSDKLLPTIKVLHGISYGDDSKQRMDVYRPQTPLKGAPVIFMVHGGAWVVGDKSSQAVVVNKVAKWVPRGFIFISVNYRLVPQADPVRQADDVAHALATAQSRATTWGGDPSRFILMGHSAGAHLVALLAAAPSRALALGAKPWLGTVLLDSAAYDVVQIMQSRHPRFYDKAFGDQPDYWRSASPFHVLTSSATPMLAVCSSRRDDSCPQAHKLAERAASMKVRVTVVEEDLSHRQINETLGQSGDYTEAVDKFIKALAKQ